MGTQYSWADELEKAAKAFGGSYPDAALEQELLEVFRERPAFVVDAIKDVTGGFEAGRIKSPWPFLRKRVGEVSVDVVVGDTSEREHKVAATEQWVRTVGLHFDREAEIIDELFGAFGCLRAWVADMPLQTRLLALWRELRPQGEAIEREATERIVRQLEALERAKQTLKKRRPFAGFKAPDGSDWVGEEPPVTTGASA